MRINEIFYSIQGEGCFSGTPALFVRMSGCNLRCSFCDTHHTPNTEMSDDEIIEEMKKLSATCRHVVITGGEPSLQLTSELVGKLHLNGYFIQVETNGTHPLPSGIDWVTCSPKFNYCDNARLHPDVKVDELKVVYDGNPSRMEAYRDIEARCRSLQPCATGDDERDKEIINSTVEYVKENPEWRLSLQTHKLINIP